MNSRQRSLFYEEFIVFLGIFIIFICSCNNADANYEVPHWAFEGIFYATDDDGNVVGGGIGFCENGVVLAQDTNNDGKFDAILLNKETTFVYNGMQEVKVLVKIIKSTERMIEISLTEKTSENSLTSKMRVEYDGKEYKLFLDDGGTGNWISALKTTKEPLQSYAFIN